MTTRPGHRKLVDQLRDWNSEQVATLLRRRPDLVHPRPPPDLADLARRAQYQPSVDAAIALTTLPENRLLQVMVCCPPDVPVEELAASLPEGVGLDDIEPVLSSLEAAALVWRHGGRVHSAGTLRLSMPTTLGPPLQQLVKDHNVDYLKSVLKLVRGALADQGFDGPMPPRAIGPDGRPPRKAELIEELEALLVGPSLVAAVLAGGSPEAGAIAVAMAEGRPFVPVDHSLYYSRYSTNTYYQRYPTYWLFERGMLLPLGDGRTAAQPREVGVALRGGRPVADLALEPPVLVVTPAEPAQVDAHAGARVEMTLDRLADLLERWEQEPAKALKSGGLGATVMKQTAAALDTGTEEAALLVELAHLAGLIETTSTARKEKRQYIHESFVGPTSGASYWLALPAAQRWFQLSTAWMRAQLWPSASGRRDVDDKMVPVLGPQYALAAPELRRGVLDVVATLAPDEATTADALAGCVYWRRPQPWLGRGVGPTVIGWIHAETELLGIMADGALSTFGRAVLAGKRRQAEEVFEAARPEPATTFTLQADLTATVVGALERSVLVELRLLADVESTGAATTLRFSDTSLRRALDAGRSGDTIMSFLEDHATKGVPKPVAYLVGDVARRYGNLQVAPAGSFVTSEDPAVLADACSHRRTRKLALRLLAPTVAVSPHPSAKVLDGLRDAGFLPTREGARGDAGNGGTGDAKGAVAGGISLGAPASSTRPRGAGAAKRGSGPDRLVEPFRARSGSRSSAAAPLDDPAATQLAEAILAGAPGAADPPGTVGLRPKAGRFPSAAPPGTLPLAFPHDPVPHAGDGDDDQDLDDAGPLADHDRSNADLFAYGDDLSDDDLIDGDLIDGDHLGDADLATVDELAILRALIADRPRSRPRRTSRGRRP